MSRTDSSRPEYPSARTDANRAPRLSLSLMNRRWKQQIPAETTNQIRSSPPFAPVRKDQRFWSLITTRPLQCRARDVLAPKEVLHPLRSKSNKSLAAVRAFTHTTTRTTRLLKMSPAGDY